MSSGEEDVCFDTLDLLCINVLSMMQVKPRGKGGGVLAGTLSQAHAVQHTWGFRASECKPEDITYKKYSQRTSIDVSSKNLSIFSLTFSPLVFDL